jgi:hypothetical protein
VAIAGALAPVELYDWFSFAAIIAHANREEIRTDFLPKPRRREFTVLLLLFFNRTRADPAYLNLGQWMGFVSFAKNG